MTNAEYRQWLIEEILNDDKQHRFDKETLSKKSIRALEIIFDNLYI